MNLGGIFSVQFIELEKEECIFSDDILSGYCFVNIFPAVSWAGWNFTLMW